MRRHTCLAFILYVLFHKKPHSEVVPCEPKATDLPDAYGRKHRLVTKGFAGVDIRDMDLDDAKARPSDGVAQGDGRVRVRARVEDDPVYAVGKSLVESVDECAFVVALKER